MRIRQHFKTIVISDLHLGSTNSRTAEVTEFLKSVDCDELIMNGDIIDSWAINRVGTGRWKKVHTDFFKVIMKMVEKHGTEIVYVRGNHDDFLDSVIPFEFFSFRCMRDYVYTSCGHRYYVTHGDIFDTVTKNMRWMSQLGDIGYTLLLWINRKYNNYRKAHELPYYSLSQALKQKVKSAVSYLSNYEQELVQFARARHCDGIICGHIHHPDNKWIYGIHYLNSGDWVESLSALVEDDSGNWNIVNYQQEFS